MRLVMMGTGPFALPTFRRLCEASGAGRHEVAALVASPLPAGAAAHRAPPSPVRQFAQQQGIEIFDPQDVNAPEAQRRLADYRANLLVVCDYGQILRAQTLAAARLGGINLHASLLPKYRGAAPINWAIYHGEKETGVTVIHMTPQVDAGPCIAQRRTSIAPDETAPELESRLAELGAELTLHAIDALATGPLEALPQDPALASRAPRLKKTDGQIDWSRSAAAIGNQIRALEPWPKTYTYWLRSGGPAVRLILGPAEAVEAADGPPGTVLCADEGRLLVAAGQGGLLLRTVQPAGKRLLESREFLRGYRVSPGDRFGPEPTADRPAR